MAFLFPPRKSQVLTVHDLPRPRALFLKVWFRGQQQPSQPETLSEPAPSRPTYLGTLHIPQDPHVTDMHTKTWEGRAYRIYLTSPTHPHFRSGPSDSQLAHTASLVFLLFLQHSSFSPARGLCSDCSFYQNVPLPDICKPHFFTSTSSDHYSCKFP